MKHCPLNPTICLTGITQLHNPFSTHDQSVRDPHMHKTKHAIQIIHHNLLPACASLTQTRDCKQAHSMSHSAHSCELQHTGLSAATSHGMTLLQRQDRSAQALVNKHMRSLHSSPRTRSQLCEDALGPIPGHNQCVPAYVLCHPQAVITVDCVKPAGG